MLLISIISCLSVSVVSARPLLAIRQEEDPYPKFPPKDDNPFLYRPKSVAENIVGLGTGLSLIYKGLFDDLFPKNQGYHYTDGREISILRGKMEGITFTEEEEAAIKKCVELHVSVRRKSRLRI